MPGPHDDSRERLSPGAGAGAQGATPMWWQELNQDVGAAEAARSDPGGTVQSYMQGHGKMAKAHAWRALVTFRCKRNHFLGWVVTTPGGLVLYCHRGEKQWDGTVPVPMATVLPDPDPDWAEVEQPIGGCRCSKLKVRTNEWIWGHVSKARSSAAGTYTVVLSSARLAGTTT